MKRLHAMPFGATPIEQGGTRFRLWAPASARVELELEGPDGVTLHAMRSSAEGWHEIVVPNARAGSKYKYRVEQRDRSVLAVPDPASRYNADDVHGASVVVDPADYTWQDAAWRGRPWHEAVVYELHVGTFTDEGSFAAAKERLPALVELGITAIELMPLADFPGHRNWGYDGVLQFAPDASYGTPQQLKELVDAAHALGLMVLLDVVYNHFGPEGNYLHAYCPQFFNPQHQTPWGSAINFDGETSRTVRDFFVHNALYWVEEYHFDGLRLDAVHAIHDDTSPDIVCEIAAALRNGPGRDRHVHLVLENDANQVRYLERDAGLVPRRATAQWSDDIHHALHRLVSGECDGYYGDYADAPLDHLARALAQGFSYQGQQSPFRGGRARGEPSAHLPPAAFVAFVQNHDQVGNRAFGGRIHTFATDQRLLDAAYACLLLSPQVPMIFMGEEHAASTPFLYFCDFGAELAQAVSSGRREEFKRFTAFRDEAARASIPDPNAESTFVSSKLRWDERERSPHRERLVRVRDLLALRRQHLQPRLARVRSGGRYRVDGDVLHVSWPLGDGASWELLAHFGAADVDLIGAADAASATTIYSSGAHVDPAGRARLEPGAVLVTLRA